ncbi:hypothetical protein Dda_4976 [Drechslerella dactyloides]|uniref:Uncharacterized protein n=1 Tax=Drechslerella dactyloides TaxID=74499 RepID=A0AAD6IYP4_DREDA|nr:hypothetical protein Dda_4976 [Drechslerella dactyloides]
MGLKAASSGRSGWQTDRLAGRTGRMGGFGVFRGGDGESKGLEVVMMMEIMKMEMDGGGGRKGRERKGRVKNGAMSQKKLEKIIRRACCSSKLSAGSVCGKHSKYYKVWVGWDDGLLFLAFGSGTTVCLGRGLEPEETVESGER